MAKTVILFNMYRGFSNELNANNCFINAVLQVILLSFIHRQSLFHLPNSVLPFATPKSFIRHVVFRLFLQ